MPELPEVQRVVDTLLPHATGRTIRRVIIHRPDYFKPAGFDWTTRLEGRRIKSISRRAKRIVFRLDNGGGFYAHLGMTGRLNIGPARECPPHTHFQVGLDTGHVLTLSDPRRFGGVVWLEEGQNDDTLGPEPLTLAPADLAARMARTRRCVKSALLDQRLVAGLGNIYVDEALHRAGIHPLQRCCDLETEAVRRLNRAIKSTLRRAINSGGSTLRDYVDADGNRGRFQSLHRVYGREGKPCRGCRAMVVRLVIGGRSTHFCPNCQPEAV